MLRQSLESIQHIILPGKCHFTIHLSELRLPVRPQVLIPETFHYLEIPVVTRDHKKLLEHLGRLRQGVELTGIHPGRHYKIPCPLWRRLYHHGSLYLDEIPGIKVFSYFPGHPVAQLQVLFHHVSPQVKVAVSHPQLIPPIGLILNRERRDP